MKVPMKISLFVLTLSVLPNLTLQQGSGEGGWYGGIELDKSCDPARSQVLSALNGTIELARVGYRETHNATSTLFNNLFNNGDQKHVRWVMSEVIKTLSGYYSPRFTFKCSSENRCENKDRGMWFDIDSNVLYLCFDDLDTPNPSLRDDYPLNHPQLRFKTPEYIMHEMLHLPSLFTAANKIDDFTWDLRVCVHLASTTVINAETGLGVLPIMNANNYVYMAYLAITNQTINLHKPKSKPPLSGSASGYTELRKLQGANGNNDTQLPPIVQVIDKGSDPNSATTSTNTSTIIAQTNPSNLRDTFQMSDVTYPNLALFPDNTDVFHGP